MERVLSLSILCLAMCITEGVAQQVFPNGMYQKLEDLRNKSVDTEIEIQVNSGYPYEVDLKRVNEFSLSSDSIRFGRLNKWVFAYRDSTGLYLNGWRNDRYKGFSKCYTEGNFLVFNSPTRPEENVASAIAFGAILGGVIGVAIASAVVIDNAEPVDNALYILSLRTGNVRLFTKEYLRSRLADHPSLLDQFDALDWLEQDKRLLDYVHILNHLTPLK